MCWCETALTVQERGGVNPVFLSHLVLHPDLTSSIWKFLGVFSILLSNSVKISHGLCQLMLGWSISEIRPHLKKNPGH